jgi:Cu(I)/Ag(I) efflux system membrane protein CusA/SilA
MWSHRQGTEIMKPLATPVIGGMVSSLLHILIVTPVIFLWLRSRELKNGTLHASFGVSVACDDSNSPESNDPKSNTSTP